MSFIISGAFGYLLVGIGIAAIWGIVTGILKGFAEGFNEGFNRDISN